MGANKKSNENGSKASRTELLKEWDEYSRSLIRALTSAVVGILTMKGLAKKKKLADKLLNELSEKKDDVIAGLLFTIKPDFREEYIASMKKIEEALEASKKK